MRGLWLFTIFPLQPHAARVIMFLSNRKDVVMAREWLLRGVDPEELKATPKEEIPQTPKSRWENFWYHHKLKFWLVLFAVVVLVVVIVQIAKRDDPDYRVLFITEKVYTDKDLEDLAAYLQAYGEDLDGDGKVEVAIENCCINVDQSRNSGVQQIQAHLVAGDRMFFVWDPTAYKFFKKTVMDEAEVGMDFLATITVQDAGLLEESKVWNWSEDDRVSKEMRERWPSLYFGVRAAVGTAEKSKDLYKDSFSLLEALVADEKPKK